jgi:AbrB family transcriptional regulator (stage V sporulation protein T)
MKSTGIVRRIDDLGRVVIPKEIRHTLRIKEGDPLELYVSDGAVCFKKYSPVAVLDDIAKEYAEVLGETSNCIVLICDTDRFIATSLKAVKPLNKPIGPFLQKVLDSGKPFVTFEDGEYDIMQEKDAWGAPQYHSALVIVPILLEGVSAGAVILTAESEDQTTPTQTEVKLAETAAKFLSKQLK